MITMNQPGTPTLVSRRCPICAQETDHAFVYAKWGYPIIRCKQCGLGATDVGTGFSADSIYDETYFQGGHRDGYADYVGSEGVLRSEFRHSLQCLRKLGATGGRLLEVGCAYGFFLAEAQSNFTTVGIELCQAAVDFCRGRGLNVMQGALTQEFLRAQGPLDVAVMLDVIEHLPDPDETITLLHDALQPGGHLMLTTGDWDSMASLILGRRWRLMTPPQHLYFFSRKNCRLLLEKNGFEVVECSKPWKLVPFGLIAYQIGNRTGLRIPWLESISRFSLPINLFDAFRIIARKV